MSNSFDHTYIVGLQMASTTSTITTSPTGVGMLVTPRLTPSMALTFAVYIPSISARQIRMDEFTKERINFTRCNAHWHFWHTKEYWAAGGLLAWNIIGVAYFYWTDSMVVHHMGGKERAHMGRVT